MHFDLAIFHIFTFQDDRSRCPGFIPYKSLQNPSMYFHFTFLGQCHFLFGHLFQQRNLQQLKINDCTHSAWDITKTYIQLFLCMRLSLLASTNRTVIRAQDFSNSLGLSSSDKNTKPLKKMEKHSFKIIIIIISLTTKFIATFHGLYLLAAYFHSFQLFLSLF